MRKKILTLVAAAAMTMAMSVTAFAAGWVQDSTGWWWDNGNGTYTNPLFYDECSDPDIIRVGDDFYLTSTTMNSVP